MKIALETDLIEEFDKIVNESKIKLGILRTCAWCLSNLMKYKHKSKDLIIKSIEFICSFLYTTDNDVITDSLMAIKNLVTIEETNDSIRNAKLDALAEQCIIPKVIEFFWDESPVMRGTALRIIGHITSNDHKILEEQVVKNWKFENVDNVLKLKIGNETRKEILWTISNLLANKNQDAISKFFDSPLLETVLHILDKELFNEVWREASWVLANLIESCEVNDRIVMQKNHDIAKRLVDMLRRSKDNPSILKMLFV